MCIAIYLYTFFYGHVSIYGSSHQPVCVCIHQKVSLFIFVYLIVFACKCFLSRVPGRHRLCSKLGELRVFPSGAETLS